MERWRKKKARLHRETVVCSARNDSSDAAKALTALDSNMTFTSPSTTGPFCRLMTAALFPTSGNTCEPPKAQRQLNSVWPGMQSVHLYVGGGTGGGGCGGGGVGGWRLLCSSPVWRRRTEIPALSSQLFSPSDHCRRLDPHLRKRKSGVNADEQQWVMCVGVWCSAGVYLLWSGCGCSWSGGF